jgi:hypothetical protein
MVTFFVLRAEGQHLRLHLGLILEALVAHAAVLPVKLAEGPYVKEMMMTMSVHCSKGFVKRWYVLKIVVAVVGYKGIVIGPLVFAKMVWVVLP